jgi:aminoglycoside phosphotransferase (APT) family kinase protein
MTPAAPDIDALRRLAAKLGEDGAEIVDVRPLSGGASQDLWVVTLRPERRVVLRRAPEGRPRTELAISIELEARLMQLAHAHGVPTPRVLHVLAPYFGLGAGFLMENV